MKKMTWTLLIACAVVAALGAGLYIFFFARANPALPADRVRVGPATFTVEIADTMAAQARGLSYRANLADGHGMLFDFGTPGVQSFWMKDMNFPLDMIWIGGGKVLGFEENAPAPASGTPLWKLPIYNSPDGTDQVLEVNAGTVAKDGIKAGDAVAVAGGSRAG